MNYNIFNQYGGDEIDDKILILKEELNKIDELEDNSENIKQKINLDKKIRDLVEIKRQNILRPFNDCNGNSIEIDDFTFSLLAYDSKANDNRGILIIKSINKINNSEKLFPIYSSKSEGGFWRLCISEKSGILVKGSDYKQSTFLDIKLQIFINNNIDKCPQQEIGNKCFFENNKNNSIFFNTVRQGILKEPFKEYSDILGNTVAQSSLPWVKNGWTINERLLELSKKLKANPEFNIQEFTIEDIYNKKQEFDNDILEINGIIIKCIFINSIVLYMLKYKLNVKRKDGTTYYKTGICPIIMTTIESKINEFGLYSKYVKAGNYIGKLFEYKDQITGDGYHKYEQYGNDYLYIGSHYIGVYPYTEINNIKLIKDSINKLLEMINKSEIDTVIECKNIINFLINSL